jgi:uncharacterized protein (DUF885 family)
MIPVRPTRSARTALASLLALALCACGAPPPTPPGAATAPPAATPSAQLNALVEGYFESYLELNPVAATFIGDHRYDDRLPLQGREYAQASEALSRRALEALGAIARAELTAADQLTYDIFEHERRTALEGSVYPAYLLPLDQFNNAASFFAQLGSGDTAQPFATVADYERFASRMAEFARWTDQVIESLRAGLRQGVVQPQVVVERMLPQLAAHVVPQVEASVFWGPVANMPATIGSADRARLATRYRELIGGVVVPAYRRLHDFLRDEYLPGARASIAWSALPQGRAWYAYLARAYTGTDLPVDSIHETGVQEIARIEAEIARIAARIGFDGDVAALAARLRADTRFHFREPEELLDAYRSMQGRVDAAVPRLFTLVPQAALEIRATEAFRAPSAAGAEYYPPAADGSRPGIFYVNTHDLPARPAYEVETIFLHEAVPGHHFQLALAIENTALPRFRRYGSDDAFSLTPDPLTAFIEGWALYAESLGAELGLFTDPYQKLGNLFAESWRAARLVVDTGIHTRGWSREQAIDYMLAHTAAGRSDATAEVERYIAWPGQALAYKIGQLRIAQLRARAEQTLGPGFDVRAFHAAVIGDGSLPLAVLERHIDRWIRDRTS